MRVYYKDTDAGGVVYHSNYLQFRRARADRVSPSLGFQQSRLWAEQGIGFFMRRCVADFLAPARLDDLLQVTSRLIEMRRASLDLQQNVTRGDLELVRLEVKLACMNNSGRPVRLPPKIRGALAKFSGNDWSEDGK